MADILQTFTSWITFYFRVSTSNNVARGAQRLAQFIVNDPLIMTVIAFFFTGFVVAILLRLYHKS